MKQSRVITEYERLCGIRQGSAGSSDKQFACGITQEQIAKGNYQRIQKEGDKI